MIINLNEHISGGRGRPRLPPLAYMLWGDAIRWTNQNSGNCVSSQLNIVLHPNWTFSCAFPLYPKKINQFVEVFLKLSSGNQNLRWPPYPEVGSHQKSKWSFSFASPLYPKNIKSIHEVFLKLSSGNQIQDGRHIRILNRREICKKHNPLIYGKHYPQAKWKEYL
jgi:hypothetical protein